MTQQASLWQNEQQAADFSELCNALYERELSILSQRSVSSTQVLQGKLKSLPHYVRRTANMMIQAETPLTLDLQNASWSAKQGAKMPLNDQDIAIVNQWYLSVELKYGLVIPIVSGSFIALDSIDRVDQKNKRFRTNANGWFDLADKSKLTKIKTESDKQVPVRLLKPNKRVMTAACAGHRWLNNHKSIPIVPSLRELLLSCTINWCNFKQPL